ncbi:MAG: hypothetical protein JW723_10280 [Bacteroidales bacterium]|nr:hypothetical protein [Bacteroidales bacterium]
MNELYEILKILLPCLVFFLMILFLVNKYFKEENRKRHHQIKTKNQEIVTPLKLQAYERIILFLERISPDNLIVRVDKPGYTCKQLHAELINTIKAEFEHNLTQQLYISVGVWEEVKNARAHLVYLINSAFEKTKPDQPSMHLSRQIFDMMVKEQRLYTTEAIKQIKEEMSSL